MCWPDVPFLLRHGSLMRFAHKFRKEGLHCWLYFFFTVSSDGIKGKFNTLKNILLVLCQLWWQRSTAWSTILRSEHVDTEDASFRCIALAVYWCIHNSLGQSGCLLRVLLSKETFRLRNTEVHHFLEDSSTQIMLPQNLLDDSKEKAITLSLPPSALSCPLLFLSKQSIGWGSLKSSGGSRLFFHEVLLYERFWRYKVHIKSLTLQHIHG